MKNALILVALVALTFVWTSATNPAEIVNEGPDITNSAFRVNGAVSPNGTGCFIINDQCSGVNYILEGDQSQYANGTVYCAVLKAVTPTGCGVSAEFRIQSIQEGLCNGGGTFCN